MSVLVACSCDKVVDEIDVISCDKCGDVACQDCVVECIHCDKFHCLNCADSDYECIKCSLSPTKIVETAILVIGKERTVVSNSAFLISKTSNYYSRDITLKLDGRDFKFMYRTIMQKKVPKDGFDYYIHFKEVVEEVEEIDSWAEYFKKHSDGIDFDY